MAKVELSAWGQTKGDVMRSSRNNSGAFNVGRKTVFMVAAVNVLMICDVGCSAEPDDPCADAEQLPCLTQLPAADCAPLYTPDFENVFNNTLNKSCTAGGGSCHSSTGAKGDLILSDKETAYAALTTARCGHALIQTDNLLCSPLLIRLGSKEPGILMPPGNPLDDNELCAIVTWIRNGAKP